MIKNETKVRVCYADTDTMGVVYYGNYPRFYEVGRNEWIRQLGFSYRDMEERGFLLPVKDMNIVYHRSARYDDLLRIVTTVRQLPGVKIQFDYEIFNENDDLLNSGTTTLVFVKADSFRPCRAPEWFMSAVRKHFES